MLGLFSFVTPIPFFDLGRQYRGLRADLLDGLEAVCERQLFVLGPHVEAFEADIQERFGVAHAFGTSSGTDAELLILLSLGVGPGDAVVTTPYTFFATAGSIARLGARPVFVDVDPATLNLSPPALEEFFSCRCAPTADGLVTDRGLRVRAVIPVHLFGLCADLDPIQASCDRHGVALVEDAAQALGSAYPSARGVRLAGSVGRAGFYSFYPTKNLGAFGDAGMAVTSDEALAERLRVFRNHGMEPRYVHHVLGGNFRMDALQAEVLGRKLPHLAGWCERRWAIAQRYREILQPLEGDGLTLPAEPYRGSVGSAGHTYHQYVLRTSRRDPLRAYLREQGIGTEVYYPRALHQQPCFASLGYLLGEFPVAERAAAECLALPIYPELSDAEVDRVGESVRAFFTTI